MHLNWSNAELMDLTLIASSLDDEKAKPLAGFHALTGCDTVKKFTSKSNEAWTKHFLQADSKILNAFCRYPQEHFSDNFEAMKRFVVTSYVPKSSKITDFAEAGWYVFLKMEKASQKKKKSGKPKDVNMGKLPPTKGVLLQHYLHSVVQAHIWHEATKVRINHVDLQEYGWKPSDEALLRLQQKTA